MRSIWKGSIGFGLVNIPVKLYSAVQDSSLDLDMLDKNDNARVKYVRVNENTGKEVEWDDIVKGYKYNGEYVILTDKDFEMANVKKSTTIEILEFVEEDEIDSIYYEQPYYLEPEKTGAKAYNLLREALKKSGKVGIVRYVMRSKEHLAILKPMNNVIVLNRIRFQQEIREPDGLELPAKKDVQAKELEMAIQLIDKYTDEFDISEYRDTYDDELMKLIEAKAKGKKLKYKKEKVVSTKATDLMAQLKASLESKQIKNNDQ